MRERVMHSSIRMGSCDSTRFGVELNGVVYFEVIAEITKGVVAKGSTSAYFQETQGCGTKGGDHSRDRHRVNDEVQ